MLWNRGAYFKDMDRWHRALVWPEDYWQPRPWLMLTSLLKGAQCGLRQNPLGEKNFKMLCVFKAQSMPFSSFSQPQSKSTVYTIKNPISEAAWAF